ncbi:class II fumarate hydratase [Pseudocolwellia sp. HL-MZ7]|uniref:class II fumarate hydratase n=1 Tax=Pseudocolwellia sp. HL-MZ7 TaxID=3400627 RepID=UPI003CEC288A
MPTNKLWGDQTNLSLQFFKIGDHQFSSEFINSLISIKRACAKVNYNEGLLNEDYFNAIKSACDQLLSKEHSEQFPLSVWQTGSGTQTNMNVNEVICTLANNYLKTSENQNYLIHPNDHVNMSQSSNDVFPTAMHIVVAGLTHHQLLQSLSHLHDKLQEKEVAFKSVLTVGRTHLMDALPLPASSVFSGYCKQLTQAKLAITESLYGVYQLAIGGTAVGGGDNAPVNFGANVAATLAEFYSLPFQSNENKYAAVSGEDALVRYTSGLKQLATVLFKIANDFRLLASGLRCGFNEWLLPSNEPGSSIMPGKVNPTQCEALSMVCLQVFGNELTVSLAASHGQLQLNTYRPVIIHNVMESIQLLSDAMLSFADNCVDGLELNTSKIDSNMTQNLSVITLLAPKLGYDVSSKIVHQAHKNNMSLAEAAESLDLYTSDEFDVLLKQELSSRYKL